jgi:TonB family protein
MLTANKRTNFFLLTLLLCAGVVPGFSQAENEPPAPADEKPYLAREVTRKAQLTSRPEPSYTQDARAHDVVGTVVLRMVLSSAGKVTNIRVIEGLPDGLTERAIEAARGIKFVPAQKDGRPVSQYATVQYNFDIYYDRDDVSRLPVITFVPRPKMTEGALRNSTRGTVVLHVALSRLGSAEIIRVVKGLPHGLTESAIEAVKQMKFEPAQRNGRPASVLLDIDVKFPPE